MRVVDTGGAIGLSAGFTAALIGGAVLYFAAHGVRPVPNPSPPGAPRDADRDAAFERYNERYIAVTRVIFRTALVVGVVGLSLFVVGAVAK